jgi:hypothetical protein
MAAANGGNMEVFLREHGNLAMTLIICCAFSFLGLVIFAFGALGQMGKDAFQSGSHLRPRKHSVRLQCSLDVSPLSA